MPNPLAHFIERQGVIVVDGGLATTLQARGHDLRDELWSAGVLLQAPDEVREVHRLFLEAGADCITTATYQANLEAFDRRGLTGVRAIGLLRHSVGIAVAARDAFWKDPDNRKGRIKPLVAASIGPYGAFLADGSEYRGRYSISDEDLYSFHRSRWRVLSGSIADLLACETIPSLREVRVLLRLLRETPDRWAWISFSCADGATLCGGASVEEAARLCDAEPRVAAIGVNCTAPEHVSALIGAIRSVARKPVIVYPNRGERYDPETGSWVEGTGSVDWSAAAEEWIRLGASGIGGCCRVGPEDIAAMRRAIPV